MAAVEFSGQSYTLAENETVLDALLRGGVAAAHACKAGSCGSCMMRATAGDLPEPSQVGLKDSWKARGYFLPCVCRPGSDLAIAPVGADARTRARLVSLDRLSADVLKIRLACEGPFDFRAGQYVTLIRESGLARSYSIASLPDEGDVELHVRLIPGGRMSGWLRDDARLGEAITILGPSGECFYVPGREDQPLLLAGTGTGLAPLWGIVRDALRCGHRGPIHLFHGAVQAAGLYLVDELRGLASAHPQVEYIPTVLHGEVSTGFAGGPGFAVGSIDRVILERLPKLGGWRGFVCGDEGIVRTLKKKLFLAGMASRDIYADPFVPAAPAV